MDLPKLAIPTDKPTHYLRDLTGREPSKAKFFLGRGFTRQDWPSLSDAFAQHAWNDWPGTIKPSPYGAKHVVTGPLDCPDGTEPDVLAVWMIKAGAVVASLVTAYPNN